MIKYVLVMIVKAWCPTEIAMIKLENCSETQNKKKFGQNMERDIHFFLVFHIKITNFRVNYVFTRVKKGSMACLGPPF